MNLQRCSTATALVAIAGIHIALVPEHLREAPYAGVLFIALSVAALVVAILLLARADRLALTAGATLGLAALTAYLASRSVGLPSLGDDVGNWLNPLGLAALACELAVVLLCTDALWQRRTGSTRPVSAAPAASSAG